MALVRCLSAMCKIMPQGGIRHCVPMHCFDLANCRRCTEACPQAGWQWPTSSARECSQVLGHGNDDVHAVCHRIWQDAWQR